MTMPSFTSTAQQQGNGSIQFTPVRPQMPDPVFKDTSKTKLNLDTIEREGGPVEPFEFTLNGRDYALIDPQDVDWQDLIVGMQNPVVFFKYVLPEADQAEFFANKVPVWKLNVLMGKYQTHFGLPSAGEAAASPR